MKSNSFTKWIIRIICILALLLILLVIAIRVLQAEKIETGSSDLKFKSVDLPFSHTADLDQSLPFMGSAALDIDGDGVDEVFLGNGRDRDDEIFKFNDGAFEKLPIKIEKQSGDATHGAAHLDVDNDGDTDLFTARESGVWLHTNEGDKFTARKIEFEIAENTTPLSVALGDVNKDGWVDLYVSGYIKNSFVEGQTIFTRPYGGYSYLLLNNGDNTWRDVSKEAGVWRQHNTFTAVFADLDNDLDSDLVIAQDTGVIEMYENTGSFPMKRVTLPVVSSYPMGLAVGDYNNDGLVDVYASNVGHTLPGGLLRGDLAKDAPFNTDYMLLRNDGGLKFSDVAGEAGIAKLGFGWGTVFADLNLDGHEDLMAAQNYAKLPLNFLMTRYPGQVMQNQGDGTFISVSKSSGALDKAFGITPVVGDYNGDGWPDIVWANLMGPAKAYINEGNGEPGAKVRLDNNTRALNALVEYPINDKTTLTRQIIAGQGLGSDQSRTVFLPAQQNGTPRPLNITYQREPTSVPNDQE